MDVAPVGLVFGEPTTNCAHFGVQVSAILSRRDEHDRMRFSTATAETQLQGNG